ncbi:MAG: 3-hydroxy-3-methylglutaryl-CoA reductase [Candidatus Pacebacteria bacterium]|nr:3-hydroxy-3-methylglutaryl-CoA reductase [Candidatus Paceibacterota bacterium]
MSSQKKDLQLEKIKQLRKSGQYKQLLEISSFDQAEVGSKNCENLIGSVEVPVGLAGPVRARLVGQEFREQHQKQEVEFFLPLATTEGALVASVNRGCKAINHGQEAMVFVERVGMTRAPVFELEDGRAAQEFSAWIKQNFREIKQLCQQTSNHLKLVSHQTWIRGRLVFVRFVFDTDQAMGMNMVTIALKHAWQQKISQFEQVRLVSISGNLCADKKPALVNKLLGRGWSVQAEVKLSEKVVKSILKTTPLDLIKAHQVKNLIGSNLAGSFSQNMHVANMVAALFLATGQDMAHIVEASQADLTVEWLKFKTGQPIQATFQKEKKQTKTEKNINNDLYISLNLPNLNLGVVGGGTGLPAFSQARNLISGQEITSSQLAAAVGLAALAGEISGLAALSSQQLASAHQQLAR